MSSRFNDNVVDVIVFKKRFPLPFAIIVSWSFEKLKKTLFASQTLKLQCYVANLPKIDFTSSYNTHSKAINLAICTHRSSSFCALCAKVSRTGQGPFVKYVGTFFDILTPPFPPMSAVSYFYTSANFKQFLTLSPLHTQNCRRLLWTAPQSGRRANVLASDVNFPADRPTEAFCF